jgi:hypothetical protein
MEATGRKKNGLASGWILVTGLLSLCLLGTGLTWWNYSRQVFCSARGMVVEGEHPLCDGQRPGYTIAVEFSREAAAHIRQGHRALISFGKNPLVFQGVVAAVKPDASRTRVLISVSEEQESGRRASHPGFASGALCSVTVDTTIPPMETAESAVVPSPR